MAKSLICVARTQEQAQKIVDELQRHGFSGKDSSIVLPKTPEIWRLEAEQAKRRTEGVAVGAAAGGVLGLLIGLATFVIPGLEPELLAVGPIVAALADAAAGSAVGVIAGALLGLRLPDYYAKEYEDALRKGGALVSVHSDDDKKRELARKIFEANGGESIAG